MSPVIGNLSLGFAVKCIVPAFLLFLVYRMYDDLDERQLRRVDAFVSFALAIYTALCTVHIVNFLMWFMRG